MKLIEAVRVELDHQIYKQCLKKGAMSKRLFWPEGKVAKLIRGEVQLKVHELDPICEDLGIRVSELLSNAEERVSINLNDPKRPAFAPCPLKDIIL